MNGFIKLDYDQNIDCIVSEWLTPPTSSEFREGMHASIEMMKEFKTGKLISDTTNLGAMSPEDMEWSSTEWVAEALKVGYHKFACILPQDIFTLMSVQETMDKVKPDQLVDVKYFSDRKEAEKWMKKNN